MGDRIRGGRRQRQARLDNIEHTEVQLDSQTVRDQLRQWALGKQSAVGAQRVALASYNDLASTLDNAGAARSFIPSSLSRLASLGDWGGHPNNVAGALRWWLGEPPPSVIVWLKPDCTRNYAHAFSSMES